ncbi:hypothetical protein Lepto7375DRAFT_7271 [Leptolyngbya sp. PCC 7375]|nr:hypothetical protein Lepto7375DRAFT_7271 [Leptolyngbya sp. PCC 7375]
MSAITLPAATTLDKRQFIALSELCYGCPTKASLQNILVTDNALYATNGHILGVLTSSHVENFSQIDSYQVYGYNTLIGDKTITQSRRIGYDKKSKVYDVNERIYTGSVDWPKNVIRLVPDSGTISITYDLDSIDPVTMFANHEHCNIVSMFIDGDTVIYVPSVRIDSDDETQSIKHYSVKHFDTNVACPNSEFQYVTSYNPDYLIDIWNLADSIGCDEFTLHITPGEIPMRFDAVNGKTGQKVFGVLMSVRMRDTDTIKTIAAR